jgi:hypothetical protein
MAEGKETSGGGQSAIEEEWYDLLPVEKKLIGYSLALGIALLVVFVFSFGVIK